MSALPDLHRARFCAERIVHDASAALAVRDLGPTAHAIYLRNARKNLDDLADSFGFELRDPGDTTAPIPVLDPITANDDVEPSVTLADAVNVWKGYAEAALHAGMTFPKAQEAFKVPFPLHHRLVFGDAPAPALAAE